MINKAIKRALKRALEDVMLALCHMKSPKFKINYLLKLEKIRKIDI
jgi:hypothetical protein